MSKMIYHNPFGYSKHKLWPKEGSRITLFSLHVGDVSYIVEKLLIMATTFIHTSPQLEVCTQSYGPPKSRES